MKPYLTSGLMRLISKEKYANIKPREIKKRKYKKLVTE